MRLNYLVFLRLVYWEASLNHVFFFLLGNAVMDFLVTTTDPTLTALSASSKLQPGEDGNYDDNDGEGRHRVFP